MKRAVLFIVCTVISMGGCIGCGLFDSHVKQMDVLNGMATSASERLKDGAMSSVHASGQAINPGVTIEGSLTYSATARYEGLAGQFSIASQGELGREVAQDQIWAIFRDKSLSDEQRRQMFEWTMQYFLQREQAAAAATPNTQGGDLTVSPEGDRIIPVE